MQTDNASCILQENHTISSINLGREVKIDLYFPANVLHRKDISLLLINDGQDLPKMDFEKILQDLYQDNKIKPLLCVGIHSGNDRRNEYGTAKILDYKGRGVKAPAYQNFIFKELLPFVRHTCMLQSFKEKSFCGFSLG